MADRAGQRVLLLLATSTGGVGRHVRSLAGGLVERGYQVSVGGPAATEELFGFRETGATFFPVEIATGLQPVRDARAAWALQRLVRGSASPDVLHAHGLRAGLVAGFVAGRVAGLVPGKARPAGLPLVTTLHNAVIPAVNPAGIRRLPVAALERLAVHRATVVLAASADLAARATALGARDVRLAPVSAPPLPVPQRSPGEIRAELGAARRPLLLAVGRLHPQKGFDVLIEAAALLGGRRPPPLVVIAGDGPAEAELRARIAAVRAPVHLLGRRSDIADLLAAADLVMLPSRWEARALIAQEALRAGRPLVATAVGGLPELLGDAALLVAPDQPAALADAVGSLLDDPARAAALAERGRRRAGSWPDEAAMLDQLTGVYAEVLGGARY